jgi:hypothetical protein
VRRESLLSDALRQILKPPAGDLKKQLMVHFESNGVMEEGVDGGGVTKVGLRSDVWRSSVSETSSAHNQYEQHLVNSGIGVGRVENDYNNLIIGRD